MFVLGSSESFCASTALHQPSPGEIKVALDFNRERHTLIVRLEEIRDVKLPAGKHTSFYPTCLTLLQFFKDVHVFNQMSVYIIHRSQHVTYIC